MNYIIEQLQKAMVADLEAALFEREEEILEHLRNSSDRRDDEDPLKFTCSLKGTINVDKNTIETAFGYSVKTVLKGKHTLRDPNQMEISFREAIE
jgi:hypothetical protein